MRALSKQNHLRLIFIGSVILNIACLSFFGKKVYNHFNQTRPALPSVFEENKWHGYDIVEFNFKGANAKIVLPERPNDSRDWIWRTQFWDEQPQVDIALLEKGFHVAFVEVTDLYGSKAAMDRFDGFYQFVTKNFGLNNKVVFEGLSRGGLDAFNWASNNVDKVSCIYADAPVIDLKSWPLGMGKGIGSAPDAKKCLKAYGMTREQLEAYEDIPLYNCVKLAKANIPLIHVCGDKDDVVPFDENTSLLADRYRAAGGEIKVVIKENAGHHPHSLEDPQPIVDFILTKTQSTPVLATSF
jgi:hypothetical protein